MHAFHTHVCIGQDRFCVFLCIIFQYMRFTRLSASVAMAFAFYTMHAFLHRLRRLLRFSSYIVPIYNVCVSASVKTAFAFSFVWRYNACVSHACLRRFLRVFFVSRYNACVSHACRRIKRLLRFPLYGVTMHAFHTLFWIHATDFAFSSYRVTMHAFHTHICIGQDGFCVFPCMVSQYMRFTRLSRRLKRLLRFHWYGVKSTCVSHASYHRFRRLLRFLWCCVTIHAFQMRICIV